MICLTEDLIAALKMNERVRDYEIIHSLPETECAYPLTKPVVCLDSLQEEETFLLGTGNRLLHGGSVQVTVFTAEQQGGAFCEECAGKVCRALLEEDGNRQITAVSVERAVYDRNSFAYKVIMNLRLREWMSVEG